MKKILSLLALVLMSCMGAWAGVVVSNTPTAVENLSTTKLYAVFVKQCYQANTNSGETTENAGYLYKDANAGSRVKVTTTYPASTPLNAAWILTRNTDGGITLRNGYQSKCINIFALNSNTTNESGFDIGDAAGKYKAVGSAADGYTLQGYDGTNYETPNKAWLNYNTSNGLWVAYDAERAAKFQFFELSITDDDALTEQYVPEGYYYIRTYNDAMYDVVQPYVTDNNGATMRLTAKNSLSLIAGLWYITQVTTDEGNYAYKIQSVQNPDKYWVSGTNAPLSTGFAKYAITYDDGRKAYRFNGHITESTIGTKHCVTPTSATTFARSRAADAATDDDFYEIIPADAVYEVTYNITATNTDDDQISWSENKWVVGTDATAGLAQISYDFFSNFAISDDNTTIDENHTTFNVTATHTLPMVPGKFYHLYNNYTTKPGYLTYVDETHVYTKDDKHATDAKNLWYVKQANDNTPYLSLCNVYNGKAVHAVTSGDQSKCCEFVDNFAYEFLKKNDRFLIFEPGTNNNVGAHGFLNGSANENLGKWSPGNRTSGTEYTVQEFDESIFIVLSKYVGDLAYNSTESFETYLTDKTAANLKDALDYYNDANNKQPITIEENKFYVIESACSAFTDGTPRAIYAAYGETVSSGHGYPDYLKWKKYSTDDNSFIFRFQKEKHYETAVAWTKYDNPAKTATDVYSIYNVAAPKNAYVGISDYEGRYGMRQRGELAEGNDNNGSARGHDGGIFALIPLGTNQFSIVARFAGTATGRNGEARWTDQATDNSTMCVNQGSNPSNNAESGDVRTYNATASANDYRAWRIREVEAPTDLTQSVTITDARAATFYTGKTLSIPDGVTAKKVIDDTTKDNGNGVYHLTYEALNGTIPAGTAVVLLGEATTYNFPRSLEPHDYVETSAAASSDNRLIGTLATGIAATGHGQDGTIYALGNQNGLVAFYHFLSETLTAGKAYLDASGLGVAGSSVRAFAIFDEEGTLTGINLAETANDNDVVFDLQGRRVQGGKTGLYIVNGKKVIR